MPEYARREHGMVSGMCRYDFDHYEPHCACFVGGRIARVEGAPPSAVPLPIPANRARSPP